MLFNCQDSNFSSSEQKDIVLCNDNILNCIPSSLFADVLDGAYLCFSVSGFVDKVLMKLKIRRLDFLTRKIGHFFMFFVL